MTRRLRAWRFVIVVGYLAVGLGVALYFAGPYALIGMPIAVLVLEPVFDWVTDARTTRRMTAAIQANGRDALTSEQIEWNFSRRAPVVIDDDPKWGKLVEGIEQNFRVALAAVLVTNSTPEPDGTYKKVWLRVPARGDRQGTRNCSNCDKDISWPPRTAREAIAWTFRLCVSHYRPAKAS